MPFFITPGLNDVIHIEALPSSSSSGVVMSCQRMTVFTEAC